MLAYRCKLHFQRLDSNQSHQLDSGACMVLLILKTCPGGQRQRLALNKSTLLVEDDCKKAYKPIESTHSVPGPCIQQNALFVAA